MIKNYDKTLQDFITDWENENDPLRRMIKIGTTGLIISYIFKNVREKIFLEDPIPLKKETGSLPSLCWLKMKHLLWYSFWAIKWFLMFHLQRNKNIILTSFFRGNKSLINILRMCRPVLQEPLFVNFGVLYKWQLLFSRNFFCFPYALFKRSVLSSLFLSEVTLFNSLFINHFGIPFNYSAELQSYMNILYRIYIAYGKMLEKFLRIHKVLYIIQDCDYLAERVVLASLCKTKKIPSIVTDHSVVFSNYLFLKCFSDFALVWGDHQKLRLYKNLNIHTKIKVLGRPLCKYNNRTLPGASSGKWLYILPAFQEAHIQSFNRSMHDSLNRINEIKEILKNEYKSSFDLIIKPHPSDNINIFKYLSALSKEPVSRLIEKTSLVFTEDSTVTVELLRYNVPVIYLADCLNNDPLGIKRKRIDYIFCHYKEDIKQKIKDAFIYTPSKSRKKAYRHYFGNYKDCRISIDTLYNETEKIYT